jgi:hypothetical protein
MLKLKITDSAYYMKTPYLIEVLCYKPEGRGFDFRWCR